MASVGVKWQAGAYSVSRAIYPKSLFSYLASLTPGSHSLVWDVGCGNGQAAVEVCALAFCFSFLLYLGFVGLLLKVGGGFMSCWNWLLGRIVK
jgi:hypothetical protein